nr:MAG: replication associated protein [Cressdnaviricota sp.]
MRFLQKIASEWKTCTYCVFQLEKGKGTKKGAIKMKDGVVHFQGYVEFKNKMRFTALKKLLPPAHWEKRRGTRHEARDYCMKEDDTQLESPLEFGRWIPGAQAPNRFMEIRMAIEDGADEMQIANDYPEEYIRHYRGLNRFITIQVLLFRYSQMELLTEAFRQEAEPRLLESNYILGQQDVVKAELLDQMEAENMEVCGSLPLMQQVDGLMDMSANTLHYSTNLMENSEDSSWPAFYGYSIDIPFSFPARCSLNLIT